MPTKKKKPKPAERASKRKPKDQPAKLEFRERRLRDIPLVERHPVPETRKYNDTLPLPFGGEVKKDAMREHGLIH